ncbi:hypothetical protein FEJ81_09870 [Natrinema versiforme]|uniref:Uncharacterized protein n=1 Tax=Natrinema versiforme TaxID=88724 RepID=A0A4P8WH29_9EURY|nr:hypothetical protein FEJ81_09870 [Natrinema versiforme]
MRYIHDGELRNQMIDPPVLFMFDEAATAGTGRTNTTLKTALLKQRKTESTPLLIGHRPSRWRWTDR